MTLKHNRSVIDSVNITITARAIYGAIKEDEMQQTLIKDEYKNLATQIALNPEMGAQITSATVNGQSFSKSTNITNAQRLNLLSLVVNMIKNKSAVSSRVTPIY